MFSKVTTAVVYGIEAITVNIETDIVRGLPNLSIVGLADTMIREAKERIRSAISNSGFKYPISRITMNMSPASIKKRGSHFDLPMAIGILSATGDVSDVLLHKYGFIGELSLDGGICPTKGVLPMVFAMKKCGMKKIIVPKENEAEASMVKDIEIYPAIDLRQVVNHLNLQDEILQYRRAKKLNRYEDYESLDYFDVKGQAYAKRAITIAVAGGHGLLMTGSPATGKTMLSERIPSVMPQLSFDEMVETTIIYSVAGLLNSERPYMRSRPFRTPYRNITMCGMLGGSMYPKPGEITLAHKGVLFLDEIGEFDQSVIDGLRVPLETKKITLARGGENYDFPADFMLVGATNPCKCGYFGDDLQRCNCTENEIYKYRSKLSGPILDRIDMHLHLIPVTYESLREENTESSADMKRKIVRARMIQKKRYINEEISLNNQLDSSNADKYCRITEGGELMLEKAYRYMPLNPRTFLKIKKVARTIADIDDKTIVTESHIAEALRYRDDFNKRRKG